MEEDLGSLAGGEQRDAHEMIACSGSRESQQDSSLYSKEQHQEIEGGDSTPLPRALGGPYLDSVFGSGRPLLPSTEKTLVNWSKFSRKPPRWLGAGAPLV